MVLRHFSTELGMMLRQTSTELGYAATAACQTSEQDLDTIGIGPTPISYAHTAYAATLFFVLSGAMLCVVLYGGFVWYWRGV